MTREHKPERIKMSVRSVTPGPGHFWFGYYDKTPWDSSGRFLLAMRAEFADRSPTGTEPVTLGRIDLLRGNRFEPFAETVTWCWQQGCMLQWLPQAPDRLVLYNSREGDRFVTIIHDLTDGSRRVLPRSTYCVSRDGRKALSVNHARLAVTRPGYGYPGLPDEYENELAPSNDGIYLMDLATGETKLILSIAQVAAVAPIEEMNGVKHRFNHLQFNTDDSRFVFLHRFARRSGNGHITRMFTARPDGSDLYLLNPNRQTSHFDWKNETYILAWARMPGAGDDNPEAYYILFRDRSSAIEVIGRDVLLSDGHCSFSPDRRWIISDTYPGREDPRRILLLYDVAANRRINIGLFESPPEFRGNERCDLHPRWNRDGRQICFDSAHEHRRSMYVADIGHIVNT